MNLLDENFPQDQCRLLRQWRVPVRVLGREMAHQGIKDGEIIPMLHRQRRVTFFTLDRDFWRRTLCHQTYCIVWLDVRADDAAFYVRRYLRHPRFRNQINRMGVVARANPSGVWWWQRDTSSPRFVAWSD